MEYKIIKDDGDIINSCSIIEESTKIALIYIDLRIKWLDIDCWSFDENTGILGVDFTSIDGDDYEISIELKDYIDYNLFSITDSKYVIKLALYKV